MDDVDSASRDRISTAHGPGKLRLLFDGVPFLTAGEAAEIVEHIRDQPLSARILREWGGRKEAEQIASLLGSLGPCPRRFGDKEGRGRLP